MKQTIGRSFSARGLLVVLALMLAGTLVLGGTLSNNARPAGPLCGPSMVFDCTMLNGTHRTIGGTHCDILRFQQHTGASCMPIGF